MKVIGHSAISQFLKSPGHCGALVYGPNYGLVCAFVDRIKSSLSLEVSFLDYAIVKKEPEILCNAALSRSLFGSGTLLIVRNIGPSEGMPKLIRDLLDNYSSCGNYIVFVGGGLDSSSQVRIFFEKSSKYASIACYADSHSSTEAVVKQWLIKNGISGDPHRLMARFYDCDRLAICSELDKLLLFFGDKRVSAEMIDELMNESSSLDVSRDSINNLCFAVLSGADPYQSFGDAMSIADCGLVSRSIIGYLIRVLKVQEQVRCGADKKFAMSNVSPPILFKFQAPFMSHVDSIPMREIEEIISGLTDFEAKRYTISPEVHNCMLLRLLAEYSKNLKGCLLR